MKSVLSILILVIPFSLGLHAQTDVYTIDFEDTATLSHVEIDTSSSTNVWQIGAPQKNVFNSAWSLPNVIVTDSVNSYPVNDTSVFEIVNTADLGYEIGHTAILEGYYFVDCDQATDYGKIEVTLDNGSTWIDLINDTAYSSYYWWFTPLPVLTGSSNGWTHFYVWLAPLGPHFNVQYGDTIRYRFTFISDSIQTNRDGLMFDNLHFEDWAESIDEISPNNLISLSPVPTKDVLHIEYNNPTGNGTLTVINSLGQTVYCTSAFSENTIDVSKMTDGTYFLIYANGEVSDSKRFIVLH